LAVKNLVWQLCTFDIIFVFDIKIYNLVRIVKFGIKLALAAFC